MMKSVRARASCKAPMQARGVRARAENEAAPGAKPGSSGPQVGTSGKSASGKKEQAEAEEQTTSVAFPGQPSGPPSAKIGAVLGSSKGRQDESLFFPTQQSLAYLDGSAPGDFGFDPLGLSDPEGAGGFVTPKWLQYGEIMNGRWAMLGAAGCIAPEVLGKLGVIPQATNILWWKTGVFPPAGTAGIYWMDPWALFWIEVVLIQFAELRRWQDYRKPGSMGKQFFLGFENVLQGSGEPAYPGGPVFNPAGMAKEGESAKVMRTRELKNGRLAMIAMLGFAAQACMTPDKGPVQNLIDHVSDPFNNNLIAALSHTTGY